MKSMASNGMMYLPLIYGNLKEPVLPEDRRGNISTPKHTSTKANNVPMLVSSVIRLLGKNKAGTDTIMPVIIVAKEGV